MSAAENLEYMPDKLDERAMAEHLGLTYRAIQTRRLKGKIPHGVWNKVNGDIIYSIRRYDEWLESNWACPPVWSSQAGQSEFDSAGREQTQSGDAKRSPIRKRRKASQPPQRYEIKLPA